MTKDDLPYGVLLLTKPNLASLSEAATTVRQYAISTLDGESIRLVRLLRSAETIEQQQSAVAQLHAWVYDLLEKDR